MDSCQIVKDHLIDYIDNSLDPSMREKLGEHLTECSSCRSLLTNFSKVMDVIEKDKHTEPRNFAETRIMQHLQTAIENRKKRTVVIPVRVLQPIAVGLSLLIALSAGVLLGSNTGRQSAINEENQKMESVRNDLNIPEFMHDQLIPFTE